MSAIIDRVGTVSGKLTVTGPQERRNGRVHWWCLCECGNRTLVAGNSLRTGRSTSCGCNWRRVTGLDGLRFGMLVVQHKSDKRGCWSCLCDCGTTVDLTAYSLTNKQSVSCGCKKRQVRDNLVGMRFGRLVVTGGPIRKQVERPAKSRLETHWSCECECGNSVNASGAHLKNGDVQSCGCYRLSQLRQAICVPNAIRARSYVVSGYKKGAKERGLVWSLTNDEAITVAEKPCHYCKIPPQRRECVSKKVEVELNGLDRKNSTVGYTLDNVVPCCSICNRAKSDMPYEEFIAYLSRFK